MAATLIEPGVSVADREVARTAYVLRSLVLETIARAVEPTGAPVVLVKGAALALTVYPHAWQREMADIDLLVSPLDEARVLRALEAAGFELEPLPASRRFSSGHFGERLLVLPIAGTRMLVEVHAHLDKLVTRPITHGDIVAHARPAPGMPTLWVPSDIDSALLVILHAAASDFEHELAWADLACLFRRGLDHDAFVARARRWRLATAAYVALRTMHALGATLVPSALVDRLRPSALRLAWLEREFRVGHYPPGKGRRRLGLPWVIRQSPLRDDMLPWFAGVAAYSAKRLAELALGHFAPTDAP